MTNTSGNRWAMFMIPAVGNVCAWIDEAALADGGRIEAENLTLVAQGPGGQLGISKMMDRAVVNLKSVAIWTFAPADLVEHLSRLWDAGAVVAANNGDLKKIEGEGRFRKIL